MAERFGSASAYHSRGTLMLAMIELFDRVMIESFGPHQINVSDKVVCMTV